MKDEVYIAVPTADDTEKDLPTEEALAIVAVNDEPKSRVCKLPFRIAGVVAILFLTAAFLCASIHHQDGKHQFVSFLRSSLGKPCKHHEDRGNDKIEQDHNKWKDVSMEEWDQLHNHPNEWQNGMMAQPPPFGPPPSVDGPAQPWWGQEHHGERHSHPNHHHHKHGWLHGKMGGSHHGMMMGRPHHEMMGGPHHGMMNGPHPFPPASDEWEGEKELEKPNHFWKWFSSNSRSSDSDSSDSDSSDSSDSKSSDSKSSDSKSSDSKSSDSKSSDSKSSDSKSSDSKSSDSKSSDSMSSDSMSSDSTSSDISISDSNSSDDINDVSIQEIPNVPNPNTLSEAYGLSEPESVLEGTDINLEEAKPIMIMRHPLFPVLPGGSKEMLLNVNEQPLSVITGQSEIIEIESFQGIGDTVEVKQP